MENVKYRKEHLQFLLFSFKKKLAFSIKPLHFICDIFCFLSKASTVTVSSGISIRYNILITTKPSFCSGYFSSPMYKQLKTCGLQVLRLQRDERSESAILL